MERILLVEPNYKNKYPPIGLMKIATYFKNKGDYVEFHKGLLSVNEVKTFDKIFITTLFTFDFVQCIQTIRYYIEIKKNSNVYVGGIAASIMPEKFKEYLPEIQLIKGQLTSSAKLGYKDDINIDELELDYDILLDIDYEYPASDSYFVYTSRGCPRKCPFCAVRILEPKFYKCDNLLTQIQRVDEKYGSKKNLLIMDNNFLYLNSYSDIIEQIKNIGYEKNKNKKRKTNILFFYVKSLKKRIADGRKYINLLNRIKNVISKMKVTKIAVESKKIFEELQLYKDDVDNKYLNLLLENSDNIIKAYEKYYSVKISGYVDFNQGLDARLFDEKKAKKLSEIALKPCRIAFDNLADKDVYINAMTIAAKFGIKHFSNYLLYNYRDKPEDLWERLYLNIDFVNKNSDKKITLFSFPMKYASIEDIDRSYIGKYWHKKYLRAMNVILNVTKGIVPKEKDFFYKAFGKNSDEFIKILTMPDDFIRNRIFFEKSGLTAEWEIVYNSLSDIQKNILLDLLDGLAEGKDYLLSDSDQLINEILKYYKIKKSKFTSRTDLEISFEK